MHSHQCSRKVKHRFHIYLFRAWSKLRPGCLKYLYSHNQADEFFFIVIFFQALDVRNSVPTNFRDAQVLGKEFSASSHQIIQGKILLSDSPWKLFTPTSIKTLDLRGREHTTKTKTFTLEPTTRDFSFIVKMHHAIYN